MSLDLRQLRRGQQIAAGGAVLLFIFMFFFKWYTVGGVLGGLADRLGVSKPSVNAWHSHSDLRWLMLLTVIIALGVVFLAASNRKLTMPVSPSVILTLLAGLTTILVAYRVIINNPGPDSVIDTKIGAWLGLISLIAITAGAYMSMRDEGVSLGEVGGRARSAFDSMTKPADSGDSSSAPEDLPARALSPNRLLDRPSGGAALSVPPLWLPERRYAGPRPDITSAE